jgi:lipopolysaccharide/colanic/teichoic acid biosynthesis glycosyltransferase
MIGSGEEIRELAKEIGGHRHYNIDIVSSIDVDQTPAVLIPEKVAIENVSTIAADLNNDKVQGILPSLYNLLFSKIRFISLDSLYEEIFDRVPVSILKHNWFLENISTTPKYVYDTLKRLMDIIISLVLGLISLVFYPFVALFIKLEDKGPLFYVQERVGQNEKPVRIIKFRSMSVSKNVDLKKDSESRITKFGAFLRKSRIDELPQLWNVLKGDLSLIGPRPELPTFVELYEKEIPYYKIRHIIKPGLSGWAQLYHDNHPHHGVAVEQTKEKLAYDLYYVKNRSFLLDLNIALKTIKKLISRQGL